MTHCVCRLLQACTPTQNWLISTSAPAPLRCSRNSAPYGTTSGLSTLPSVRSFLQVKPFCNAHLVAGPSNNSPCAHIASVVADNDFDHRDACYTKRTVQPVGVCSNYGAPEQLRSVQLQRMGHFDHSEVMINGPAADMWAVGVVMYELVSNVRQSCVLQRYKCFTCLGRDAAQPLVTACQ